MVSPGVSISRSNDASWTSVFELRVVLSFAQAGEELFYPAQLFSVNLSPRWYMYIRFRW